MGTRNVIAVVANNTYKIAQYGQWDGYPEGQGIGVLEFCRSHLTNSLGRRYFIDQMEKIKFIDTSEAWMKAMGKDLNENPYITFDEAAEFNKTYQYLNRDLGSLALEMIYNDENEIIELVNDIDFVENRSCEWAYIIDLDNLILEVYSWHKTDKHGRFGSACVYLVENFSLESLPSNEIFLKTIDDRLGKDEEE